MLRGPPRKQVRGRPRSGAGIGLIEVLVALLVLSIGLLGIASLQMTNLKTVRDSGLRSQIVERTEGMMDRIRANVPALREGGYTFTDAASATAQTCTDCTASQLAENDVYVWYSSFSGSDLPLKEGGVSISCFPSGCEPGAVVSISVAWTDREADNTTVDKGYTLNSVP